MGLRILDLGMEGLHSDVIKLGVQGLGLRLGMFWASGVGLNV